MRKILFVSGTLNRGGAQRVLTLLANEYAKSGWDVHLVVLLDDEVGYALNDKIKVHSLVRKGNYMKNVFGWTRGIRRLIRKEAIDVVVSFVGRINMITMLAAIGTGVPVLISERNDPARDRRNKIERQLCKLFYHFADRVVFQTQYQANYYKKQCASNGVIIGNPISMQKYYAEHSGNDVICVGKLMPQKNHPMMIRAFSKIEKEFPDMNVLIYGDGDQKDELQSLIEASGMGDRIHLCGNSDRIFDVMREQKYFVMCSDYEGLSNALLEAMMSGMVCITTAWSGVEDFVVDGENGYLVPVGDADALAEKMRSVFTADNHALRENAIKSADQFSTANVMSKWINVIDEVYERRTKK